MKTVFLSPSTQERNVGPGGYIEEVQMNKIADVAQKILKDVYGIKVYRNDPDCTVGNSVRQSNGCQPHCHIAIHSNAGGGEGCEVYHNTEGKRLAALIYDGITNMSNRKGRGVKGNGGLYETTHTTSPTILVEVDFHDSADGAKFITDNINKMGDIIARSAARFLNVSAIKPAFNIIKIGDSGARVKKLQELLNKHWSNLDEDGKFGDKTLKAVEAFQRHKSLKVTGVADEATWIELQSH